MKKWNADLMIPTDSNYIIRIADAEVKLSNAGQPMIVMVPEINTPAEVMIGEDQVNIAGVKCRPIYRTFKCVDEEGNIDQKKTKDARERIMKEFYGPIGLTPEEVNWENPDVSILKGKAFYCIVKSNIVEKRKTPTQVQIETARKSGKYAEGDVMLHPITKKALVQYWPETDEIFGYCPEQSVSAIA